MMTARARFLRAALGNGSSQQVGANPRVAQLAVNCSTAHGSRVLGLANGSLPLGSDRCLRRRREGIATQSLASWLLSSPARRFFRRPEFLPPRRRFRPRSLLLSVNRARSHVAWPSGCAFGLVGLSRRLSWRRLALERELKRERMVGLRSPSQPSSLMVTERSSRDVAMASPTLPRVHASQYSSYRDRQPMQKGETLTPGITVTVTSSRDPDQAKFFVLASALGHDDHDDCDGSTGGSASPKTAESPKSAG
jgi:hypothetical protein